MIALHFPRNIGFDALTELDSVPWGKLAHAYGVGITGLGLAHDVKSALRALSKDADEALGDGLYSCVFHQGTVYEASAYAVPYLAAITAGQIDPHLRLQLVLLLGDIARSASFEARAATEPGAWGINVAPRLYDAFKGSGANLRAAATLVDPQVAEVLHAIVAATETPSIEMSAFLDDTFERLEEALGLKP